MLLPYQCLIARDNSSSNLTDWTLFGASGSQLVVQSNTGATSVWREQDVRDEEKGDGSIEPPGKRIKLDESQERHASFSNLTLTHDGCHLVGVTGEDKCIRVFQIDSQRRLHQLSKRCMSRRPCSITLTQDDATILCADKFGDVYALPLLVSSEEEESESTSVEPPVEQSFTPAATTLTVHSGRNRKTLEDQLKQKAQGVVKSKDPMKFKHELLLGHVSMLTDILHVTVDSRNYIMTADRDEHIRISRGQPQAHLIEGFCFGHEAFVSKLCLTRSGLLISGGGDDHLLVWEWQNYRLVEKLPIRDVVLAYVKSQTELSSAVPGDVEFLVAVSGIWDVPGGDGSSNEVLVACEGVPALFSFKLGRTEASGDSIPLKGNALGVALVQTRATNNKIVVSIDNLHKPGSTTQARDSEEILRLQYFSNVQGDQWREDKTTKAELAWFEAQGIEGPMEALSGGKAMETPPQEGSHSRQTAHKAVQDMLYHIENLRKRPGAEDKEAS